MAATTSSGAQPEIDIVGADRAPVATTVFYTGSIKWSAGSWHARLSMLVRLQIRIVTGAVLHPLGGYLLHCGLTTLPLRVEVAQATRPSSRRG